MERNQRNTLALKGISIILGILLWLFVTNENVITTRHTVTGVSVTAENLGAGYKVVFNDTVDLEVSGKTLDRSALKASVDLNELGPGKHQVPVNVKVPSGVKLIKVTPAVISVNIMEVSEKVVPVEVRPDKEPPEGYQVTGMAASPAQVLVRGGYPDLTRVTGVRANIDLSETKSTATLPVKLFPVDREGKEVTGIKVIPEEGQVYVVVEADKDEVSLPVKVEVQGQLPAEYSIASISTEPAEVKAYGSKDVLSTLTEVVTEPLDLEGITENTTRDIKLVPTAGIVYNPSTVLVKVEIKSGSANP